MEFAISKLPSTSALAPIRTNPDSIESQNKRMLNAGCFNEVQMPSIPTVFFEYQPRVQDQLNLSLEEAAYYEAEKKKLEQVIEHVGMKGRENELNYVCDICEEVMYDMSNLLLHVIIHKNEQQFINLKDPATETEAIESKREKIGARQLQSQQVQTEQQQQQRERKRHQQQSSIPTLTPHISVFQQWPTVVEAPAELSLPIQSPNSTPTPVITSVFSWSDSIVGKIGASIVSSRSTSAESNDPEVSICSPHQKQFASELPSSSSESSSRSPFLRIKVSSLGAFATRRSHFDHTYSKIKPTPPAVSSLSNYSSPRMSKAPVSAASSFYLQANAKANVNYTQTGDLSNGRNNPVHSQHHSHLRYDLHPYQQYDTQTKTYQSQSFQNPASLNTPQSYHSPPSLQYDKANPCMSSSHVNYNDRNELDLNSPQRMPMILDPDHEPQKEKKKRGQNKPSWDVVQKNWELGLAQFTNGGNSSSSYSTLNSTPILSSLLNKPVDTFVCPTPMSSSASTGIKFKCHYCWLWFMNSRDVVQHEFGFHKVSKIWQFCENCGKRFSSVNTIHTHKLKFHSDANTNQE